MKYAVELAINQANAGTSLRQPAVQAEVHRGRRPGLADAVAYRGGVAGHQLEGRRRRRPGLLRRHGGRRAELLGGEPRHGEPVGDQPDPRRRGLAQLLPRGRRRQHPGPRRRRATSPRCSSTRRSYVVNDASTYGAGLAGAVASTLQASRRDRQHPDRTGHDAVPGRAAATSRSTRRSPRRSRAPTRSSSSTPATTAASLCFAKAAARRRLHRPADVRRRQPRPALRDPGRPRRSPTGTYISCPCRHRRHGQGRQGLRRVQFQKLAGFPVGTYSAESYDATNTIIDVMKSLGSHDHPLGDRRRAAQGEVHGPHQDGQVPVRRQHRR